ncbi:MAG: hypothetical protein ACYS67_15795 [Planctomycetota bacterium]|jgi:hypothetical protein
MIRFCCKHCGQKIRVPEVGAGRKGKCPKCNNMVLVPKVEDITPVASPAELKTSEIVSGDAVLDSSRFDIVQEGKAAGKGAFEDSASDTAMDELQRLQGSLRRVEPEPLPERKLPWFVDIFLYPISKAGLSTMGIIICVPLAISLFLYLLGLIMLVFPPMLVFVVFFGLVGWLIRIVISLYAYWYLCECIRDSADGGIRAPETMATTPGIGEIFWQFMKLAGCLIFFWVPLAVYVYLLGGRWLFIFAGNDPVESGFSPFIVILLWAYAVFFFPMGLLSVVWFDSLTGLNPVLIIGSILSTFFQYCGLILLFFAIGVLSIISMTVLPQFWILRIFSGVILLYMAMVYAHLMGRFYWKYREKLNWDV